MIVVIGASGDTPPATTFWRKSVSVTMPNPPAVGDEESRDALRAHQTGGFSDCSFWTAEHRRRCYEVADADRANLRQAVDGVTGAGEPLAHGPGNEYGTGRPAENLQRSLPPDQVAGGVFVRPDGECRRHARQQRWVAEALSGLEDVHHLILVAELDRAAANDEKLLRRGAVLDQNVGARGVGPDRDRRGDAQQIVPAKLIEWGETGRGSRQSLPRCLSSGASLNWPVEAQEKATTTTDGPSAIKKREGRWRSLM